MPTTPRRTTRTRATNHRPMNASRRDATLYRLEEVVLAEGFSSLSMDPIAARLRISTPTCRSAFIRCVHRHSPILDLAKIYSFPAKTIPELGAGEDLSGRYECPVPKMAVEAHAISGSPSGETSKQQYLLLLTTVGAACTPAAQSIPRSICGCVKWTAPCASRIGGRPRGR